MKIGGRKSQRKVLISLTPLVDIIFILLVFFMLASSFLDWRSVVLQTPAQARPNIQKPVKTLRIRLTGEQEIRLDGRKISGDRLGPEIERIVRTTDRVAALVIVGDGVSLQHSIGVLQQVTDAGVAKARLAAAGKRKAE